MLRLIKQAYRLAVDHDFLHLACELSSILYHDHVYYHRNPRKARFYAAQVDKYLNDTFRAQADKQGDNINIVIAELLVYLARDRGKFIDRIEAVKHYSYRHLKSKETQRAKWFIKILCLMPSVNFHPIALARRAKKNIDRLHQHPIRLGERLTIEIIPFEALLDMIMQQLKQKVA